MVHMTVQPTQVGMDHEAASQVLDACPRLRTTMPTTGTNTLHNVTQKVLYIWNQAKITSNIRK